MNLTRRQFLRRGTLTAASAIGVSLTIRSTAAAAQDAPGPFFTRPEEFRDVSRGQPLPHTLSPEQKRKAGLTRETWKLEVISDPDAPAKLGQELTQKNGTALDFPALLKLAERSGVRFTKTLSCLNIGQPLGTGIWEGVPLRDVLWLTRPRENVRRVFYYGYHNDDPRQMFRSSLPIDRAWEDPFDLPPVILCYKLNGQWLSSTRGGPVRIVVPEAYGFKSIKWLKHIVLSNLFHANDTYAEGNNDIDSSMKTFAATLSVPEKIKPGEPIPVAGYAQVGTSGLSKVQAWIHSNASDWPGDDRYFATAPWTDAVILPPPPRWDDLPEGRIPPSTWGFDDNGQPRAWPMRLLKVHWTAVLPGLPAGQYTLRSRTIDTKGVAQPMPRPFAKSGHSALEAVAISVGRE